jgi:hypothetical protein
MQQAHLPSMSPARLLQLAMTHGCAFPVMGLESTICGSVDRWDLFKSACPRFAECMCLPFLLCTACFAKKKCCGKAQDNADSTEVNSPEGSKEETYQSNYKVMVRRVSGMRSSGVTSKD